MQAALGDQVDDLAEPVDRHRDADHAQQDDDRVDGAGRGVAAARVPIAIADDHPDDGRAEHERQGDRQRLGELRDDPHAPVDERREVPRDEQVLHHQPVPDRQRPVEAERVPHLGQRLAGRRCGRRSAPPGRRPGVAKKIRNTSTLIAKSTKTAAAVAAQEEGEHQAPAPAQPGARVERLADAVAEQVEQHGGQRDRDARGDRHHGPGVEQPEPVVDDRPPAGLRRLHADRQERQRRLGEHVERGHQRQEDHDGRQHVGQHVLAHDLAGREAPTPIAAATNSRCRSAITWPRSGRATYGT